MYIGNGGWGVGQAVGDNPSCTVLFGEVIKCPNCRNFNIHLWWKGEHVEAPLIAVQTLGLTAWSDIDYLGEM
jgi:hypothetical protein